MNPTDFWPSCGFDPADRDARGWLRPNARLFLAYVQRPELALVPESCQAERQLHRRLQDDPLCRVAPRDLERIKDADARENYQVFLRFRDAVLDAGTLEAHYLQMLRQGVQGVPREFMDLQVQAILRNLLDGTQDAQTLRAAELLFRPQTITVQDGQVLAADQVVVERHAQSGGLGELGRLLMENKTPLREAQLQVLNANNADRYWGRSERFDTVLDLTHELTHELSHGLMLRLARARSGLKALSQVLESWVQHFLAVPVRITPLPSVEDAAWRWHIGLDAEATAILNDLYESRPVDTVRQQRLLSLFRLTFANPQDMQAEVAGKPVYLGLAMNAAHILRLKPQNLLLNLPLRPTS